jgi:hypothetical protein
MSGSPIFRQLLFVSCLLLITGSVFAKVQHKSRSGEPQIAQDGKDVVWVPTAQVLANKMLSLAKVTPQDYVIDLGSGDGRIVITAAKIGAHAQGIEYNSDLVALSKRNATKAGVSDKAKFIQADLFESDFSQATVITMFLLTRLNLQLRPRILDLKPGTRVVSNSFDMREWEADETVTVSAEEGCNEDYCEAYLWIVPAKVGGTWKLPQGELILQQQFQMISGILRGVISTTEIMNGKLNGDQISFTVGEGQYKGRVSGNIMQGTFHTEGKTTNWSATRIADIVFH